VDRLHARLRDWGYESLFLDYHPEDGVAAGREWERDLYLSLRACRGVDVLCGQAAMSSKWVFAELSQAKALGKELFPVNLDGCEVDRRLAERQIIDLRAEGEEVGWARLRRGLELAGLSPGDDFAWDRRRPPYPGLDAFSVADAGVYFGRESEIGEVRDTLTRLTRTGRPRLVLVVGGSTTSGSPTSLRPSAA
jgi:hypothetical protein